jgi:hypothetical protein
VDTKVRRLDWRMAFGLPNHHMKLVLAKKPTASPINS